MATDGRREIISAEHMEVTEEHSLQGEGPAELTIKGLGGGLLCGRVLRGGGRHNGLGMAPRCQHAWVALKHGGKHRLEWQTEMVSTGLGRHNLCTAMLWPCHNYLIWTFTNYYYVDAILLTL